MISERPTSSLNAGFAVYRTFEQSSPDEIGRLMKVNLLSAMILTKCLLPAFIHRLSGIIANMASIAGTTAITPNGTYCAAKHGLVPGLKICVMSLRILI